MAADRRQLAVLDLASLAALISLSSVFADSADSALAVAVWLDVGRIIAASLGLQLGLVVVTGRFHPERHKLRVRELTGLEKLLNLPFVCCRLQSLPGFFQPDTLP